VLADLELVLGCRVEEIVDLLVVNLQVANLHLEGLGWLRVRVNPLKEGLAEAGNNALLLRLSAHHSVHMGLSATLVNAGQERRRKNRSSRVTLSTSCLAIGKNTRIVSQESCGRR